VAIQKPEQAFLKRVTGRSFTVSKDLTEISRNSVLDFLHKKIGKNCENHQRSYKQYNTVLILRPSKEIIL
jgi:hypothetical protein